MNERDGFHAGPDEELGAMLEQGLAGPDPSGFLQRLQATLRRLPEPASQWDVLATWARPRVVAGAMAAAFLLGIALYANWRAHEMVSTELAEVPAAALMAPNPTQASAITFAVLEGR